MKIHILIYPTTWVVVQQLIVSEIVLISVNRNSKIQKLFFLVLLGAASIAATAGILTSLKPIPDAPVIAAVITGLLGLILGGSALFIQEPNEPSTALIWGWGAIVFCSVFVCVLFLMKMIYLPDGRQELIYELGLRQEIHFTYLQECSRFEFLINEQRKELNLPPLSNDIVCRELLP